MRPTRLELAGFTSFRDRTVVDFAGAELFALTGPTGAGKSSVIDALCFALYGSVPRYDDRKLVAPVISQGRLEAKVRLDFAVDGVEHTAVRVVRRTTGGRATTKEARLQRGGTTLAGDANAVTAQVEALLGLAFEQFTTCVVLPQGEFARFLHDTPAGRQELLVRLLDLGLYQRIAQAARQRAALVSQAARLLEAQLADLADATPEARAALVDRVSRLDDLRAEMDAAKPDIDELAERARRAREQQRDDEQRAERLGALAVPAGLSDLVGSARAAAADLEAARVWLTEAERRLADSEQARADLPDAAALRGFAADHAERKRLTRDRSAAQQRAAEAGADQRRRAAALEEACAQLTVATQALEAARRAHAADDLAAHLQPGQSCPVCRQPVGELPARETPADLAEAERAVETARAAQRHADDRLRAAGQRRAIAQETLRGIDGQLGRLEDRLAGAPSPAEVQRLLTAIAQAEAEIAAARTALGGARADLDGARRRAAAVEARQRRAWDAFDAARDAVAALQPPAADRSDLTASWQTLVEWAQTSAPAARAAARRAATTAQTAEAERRDLVDAFRGACVALGVQLDAPPAAPAVPPSPRPDPRPPAAPAAPPSPRDACVEALSETRAQLRRVDEALAKAAALRADRDAQVKQAAVAKSLAAHLDARGFEGWLLDEALELLLVGASATLQQLSAGQYSLAVDDKRRFQVVDHRNADELRPAKTLSGGETFLASLALALALADQLADLAAHGAARLEAIFLDEGFGTLDPETLDTVAAAVEELGARGRIVGLVTHVRDLAERMPVRFEVHKGPAGSGIRRQVA